MRALIRNLVEDIYRFNNPNSLFKIKGLLFYLPNKRDGVQQQMIFKKDFYDRENLAVVKKYVKEGSNILDIGANIGNHTVYFGRVLNIFHKRIPPC